MVSATFHGNHDNRSSKPWAWFSIVEKTCRTIRHLCEHFWHASSASFACSRASIAFHYFCWLQRCPAVSSRVISHAAFFRLFHIVQLALFRDILVSFFTALIITECFARETSITNSERSRLILRLVLWDIYIYMYVYVCVCFLHTHTHTHTHTHARARAYLVVEIIRMTISHIPFIFFSDCSSMPRFL